MSEYLSHLKFHTDPQLSKMVSLKQWKIYFDADFVTFSKSFFLSKSTKQHSPSFLVYHCWYLLFWKSVYFIGKMSLQNVLPGKPNWRGHWCLITWAISNFTPNPYSIPMVFLKQLYIFDTEFVTFSKSFFLCKSAK